jgi:hypothetical protein
LFRVGKSYLIKTYNISVYIEKSQEIFLRFKIIEKYQQVNYPAHKGMGLVIQVPISGQTTIGGLTAALSFRKSARIFIAAL